jgi:hypothetical protein
MSNYTKATDFAAKDALLSGDPAKVIKGTEIDTEYNAIAVAVSTKVDSVSPTFTGTPAAPTATPGTNTTQIATTAFVTAADTAAIAAERTATATLTNKTLTSPAINTATIVGGSVTGITDLVVADGGTGVSALTAENVLIGDGTNPVKFVAPGSSGNVLVSNGSAWTSAVAPVSATGGNGQVFTGNGTFTIPTGITRVKATVLAGGGGATSNRGGGAGGAAIKYLTSLTPGNTISVTVGAGGAANTVGGSSQIASGTQSITTVSATGGDRGQTADGNGGIGSNGDLNIRGGGAGNGQSSGQGGNSIFGAGAPTRTTGGVGIVGGAFGGGGGVSQDIGCCGFPGGAGGAGVVFFEW